jgi:hypothetical protein
MIFSKHANSNSINNGIGNFGLAGVATIAAAYAYNTSNLNNTGVAILLG